MPSLKDLKNRIDSVKSTRKITKAMQMVAAAKLRRAQEAAEASRPYTERFNAGSGRARQGRRRVRGRAAAAARHRRRPGAPAGGDDRRARPLRRLQLVDREARQVDADTLIGQGKTVKILTVGKKGREQLKREYVEVFHRSRRPLGPCARSATPMAQGIANDLIARFEAGEFDVATIFFAAFQSVITPGSRRRSR